MAIGDALMEHTHLIYLKNFVWDFFIELIHLSAGIEPAFQLAGLEEQICSLSTTQPMRETPYRL